MQHVFAVSDATGRSAELVARAALAQFPGTQVELERLGEVSSPAQVDELMARAASVNAFVVFTVVTPRLAEQLQALGRARGVVTFDLLGPLLLRLADQLARPPAAQPGLLRHLDEEYFRRIEAVDFAVKHDDGLGAATLAEADVVLVGVSRASKTPTAMYLAHHGLKAANVPVVLDAGLPDELEQLPQGRVVALTLSRHVLQGIRRHRQAALGVGAASAYASTPQIERELAFARRLFAERAWPLVDVTHKSVEEIAAEVMRLVR